MKREISLEKSENPKIGTSRDIVGRLWYVEQGELGFPAFQQSGVASALVAAIADVFLVDVAVAGLQFSDKVALGYPAGA